MFLSLYPLVQECPTALQVDLEKNGATKLVHQRLSEVQVCFQLLRLCSSNLDQSTELLYRRSFLMLLLPACWFQMFQPSIDIHPKPLLEDIHLADEPHGPNLYG